MLARLYVALPFHIAVPEDKTFSIFAYEDEGYEIRVFPPGRTDQPLLEEIPDDVKINGEAAFIADGLKIEFRKDSFNRTSGGEFDPPMRVVERAVHSFLLRLRYVTRGEQIRLVNLKESRWRIRYLDDHGNELQEEPQKVRGLGGYAFKFSVVGVNPTVWDNIHELSPDFSVPIWDTLCLDARAALPNIGTAVVLASAALEVFISQLLDKLAPASDVPDAIWSWINDRGDYLKEPSVQEQFDILLHHMVGHSLKEDERLWEIFKNLRKARNSFAHEGIAMLGKNEKKPISVEQATGLVNGVSSIIRWIKQWLPERAQWPEFQPSIKFKISYKPPFRSSSDPDESADEDTTD